MNSTSEMVMDRKIINITNKRQVTIPLKFYEKLQFGKEVECFLTNGAIVIRPLSNLHDDFSMEILNDLVSQGYGGNELLEKFAHQQQKIKAAIESLIEEADDIAEGKRVSATTEELFGES